MRVIVNSLRCKKCNDVISSRYAHDYKHCECGSIFIDGGTDYQRCGWTDSDSSVSDYIDFSLSVYDDVSEKPHRLDEVLAIVKELTEQVEALKNQSNVYKTRHYEQLMKGHLAELIKLKRMLDKSE